MKLTREGLHDRSAWEQAGIILPGYDVEEVSKKAVSAPRWVHFGIGNIFRIFLGSIADGLLESGELDRGLTCVETFDHEVVDKIYRPFDNLALSVILFGDGHRDLKVLGSFAEAVKAEYSDRDAWNRLKEIFIAPSLQMVSFTITEKGYALKKTDGTYLGYVAQDIADGPDKCTGAMAVVTAMLYARYQNGAIPIALVSMDNVSHNGAMLRSSVLTMAEEWQNNGFVDAGFLAWIGDETKVSFPWTMIDKITPRPSPALAAELETMGVENMSPVETAKRTYIAPFVNGEDPQYLVIEDNFPNGRPALEHGKGVFLGDRDTVNKAERMKVTALLNPVHSALGPLGVVLGEEYFATMLNNDPLLMKMARMVEYKEGLPVAPDPGIISPQAFADELFNDRFVNEYLGDVNLRLCTDVSQGLGVRFGETIKTYARSGNIDSLLAIPLGIAGWLRYVMAVDDHGNSYVLAPDPLNEEVSAALSDIVLGEPETLKDQLRPILSNEAIFFTDLYEAGIGRKIEGFFREMIAGKGAARATIEKYIK